MLITRQALCHRNLTLNVIYPTILTTFKFLINILWTHTVYETRMKGGLYMPTMKMALACPYLVL